MSVPLDISIFLNNALSASHFAAESESDTPLPDAIREMPETVSGHFVALGESRHRRYCRGVEAHDDSERHARSLCVHVRPGIRELRGPQTLGILW
jgi:hypothetical protein